MTHRTFPPGFVWGVAAAAPQIEGAAHEGGRGLPNWDVFSLQPGKIRNGDTPAVACDHYHRFREDVALIAQLGLKHYRLSVAWPRVLPDGVGAVNPAGLDFYDRLVDALLAHDITPWVTLFHWDLPQALEERGGWRNRATVDAFATYADVVVRRLGDRVKRWFTLNEIICFTQRAYGTGEMAPGLREDEAVVNQTYHHALLCHGHGVRAVREYGGPGAVVGLVDNPAISIPLTETAADIAAARRLFVHESLRVLGPIHAGGYGVDYLAVFGASRPLVGEGDFELISQPTDFLGLNIYWGSFIRAGAEGQPERVPFPANYPAADCRWLKFTPQAIYWGARFAAEAFGARSVYITENGAGFEDDAVGAGGEVRDLHRREYLRGYLRELERAITDGVPVHGYFLWSLLDNFEWHDGYATRFGIVHTDYLTQHRTPKLSAHWYSEVARGNRLV
jgi:beta-glucosidase